MGQKLRIVFLHPLIFGALCYFLLGCNSPQPDPTEDKSAQTRVRLREAWLKIPGDIEKYGGSVYRYGQWRDGWGNDFRVKTQKKGDKVWYEVRSSGPDGAFDTEDDIFQASGPALKIKAHFEQD